MDEETRTEEASTSEKNKPALDLKINLKQVELSARLAKQKEVHEFIRANESNFDKMEKSFADALSFILINYSLEKSHMREFLDLSAQYDFTRTLCNLLERSIPILNKTLESTASEQISQKNLLPIFITYTLTSIIKSFSSNSIKFRLVFKELKGVDLLFQVIDDELLIENSSKEISVEDLEIFPYRRIIRCCLGTLLNFCRDDVNFVLEGKALESLIKCSSKLSNIEDIRLSCIIVLSLVVSYKDSLRYEIKCVLPEIINVIGTIVALLKNKKVKRTKVHLSEESRDEIEISFFNFSSLNLNLLDMLKALYRLALVDAYKSLIYFDFKMCDHLRTVIYFGNIVEVEQSLTLLYQLCFEFKISKDVHDDTELHQKIVEFQHDQHQNLVNIAKAMLWLVERKVNHDLEIVPTNNDTTKQNESESEKQIIISHCNQSRDLCLDIKRELENMKYKVWLNDNASFNMNKLTEALQNAMCVLMCMTEKYKQSPYCRTEAEYAFEMNKPIIPLLINNDFEPSGWLEGLAKIFENLKQFQTGQKSVSFQKSPKSTVRTKIKAEKQTTNAKKKNSKKVLDWTESQVNEWLKEKKIHKKIIENITPCNGKLLGQLYSIKSEAPEFFYHSVASNKTLPTIEIVLFVSELTNLFDQ